MAKKRKNITHTGVTKRIREILREDPEIKPSEVIAALGCSDATFYQTRKRMGLGAGNNKKPRKKPAKPASAEKKRKVDDFKDITDELYAAHLFVQECGGDIDRAKLRLEQYARVIDTNVNPIHL